MRTVTDQRTGTRLVAETDFLWRARRADAVHRLVCFPHGGGGARAYLSWAARMPPGIELVAVQLPGRQNRVHELSAAGVSPLVRQIVAALRPLEDLPLSFFGHSCGGLLAFEVARTLHVLRRPVPAQLFVSAQAAPEVMRARPKLHELGEREFRLEVLRLGGFDESLLADEDAMELLFPAVLADFELWERFRIPVAPLLRTPITCLVGADDVRAPAASVRGWAARTVAEFETRTFPGGHFYLSDSVDEVLALVGEKILVAPVQ